jgi:hypothetical protein
MSLSTFFSTMATDVEHIFSDDVLPIAQAFIQALVSSISNNGGNLLIQAATEAATSALATGGDASAILNNAVTSARATLTAGGVTVVEEALTGAVSAALAKLNTELTANVSTATASAEVSANQLGS